jgi:hypothetical protein
MTQPPGPQESWGTADDVKMTTAQIREILTAALKLTDKLTVLVLALIKAQSAR